MPRRVDLIGKRFGRWLVEKQGPYASHQTRWYCRCDCGNTGLVLAGSLANNRSKSCGCLSTEMKERGFNLRHGGRHTFEYRAWCNAKARCFNPRAIGYKRYGGRGITMCERWVASFEAFFADMGTCPPEHSLERCDTDGNYEPDNCRWATRIEQMNNMSRNVRVFCSDGIARTLAELSRHTGINYGTLRSRYLKHGAQYVSQI